jgi:hypothetical protein
MVATLDDARRRKSSNFMLRDRLRDEQPSHSESGGGEHISSPKDPDRGNEGDCRGHAGEDCLQDTDRRIDRDEHTDDHQENENAEVQDADRPRSQDYL